MSKIQEYKKYFKPDAVPETLAKLIEFAETQEGWFSQSFELELDEDDAMFSSYSSKPEFLSNLFHIGQADGTGSAYAIWRQGDLNNSPIVIFGSEGGVHIVASNLAELLRILTIDCEPMADWDGVGYCDPEDASDGAEDFAKWLKKEFKLSPVKNSKEVDKIIAAAQKAHGAKFKTWLKKYYDN